MVEISIVIGIVKEVSHFEYKNQRINGVDSCLAINLHEDYDADGIYLYESTVRKKHDDLANEILNAGKSIYPSTHGKKLKVVGRKMVLFVRQKTLA